MNPENSDKSERRVSITVLLTVAIGGLVGLTCGTLLLISAYSNLKNTSELVESSARSFMDSMESEVKIHLAPAVSIVDFLVQQSTDGHFDPANEAASVSLLSGTLAGAPQVSDVAVWQPDGQAIAVSSDEQRRLNVNTQSNTSTSEISAYLDNVRNRGKSVWEPPFRSDGTTFISVAAPLFQQERFLGVAEASISVEELSALVSELGEAYEVNGFILHGGNKVLAHESLPSLPQTDLNDYNPLHSVAVLNDPVVSKFLVEKPRFKKLANGVAVHDVTVEDRQYIILSQKIPGYGDTPWVLGAYSLKSDWDTQIRRLITSLIAGALLSCLAVVAAIFLARGVAKPIQRNAHATMKIGSLDLDKVDYLPASWITEINNQTKSFNQMLDGSRWFETYVPRTLVRTLVQQRGEAIIESRELELTVMFTDIIGFTANCENKTPPEIAKMLNRHFEIVNRCIEAEGGTLDKYIGDAVMAFWGAPLDQKDHADRACRTAQAIAREFDAAGIEERIKIAIHSGPLIVGNIGAPERMNYTVIGDTVNTCSRIEKLAGDQDDGSKAIIVLSDATVAQLNGDLECTKVGDFAVKGKSNPVVLFRLPPAH